MGTSLKVRNQTQVVGDSMDDQEAHEKNSNGRKNSIEYGKRSRQLGGIQNCC